MKYKIITLIGLVVIIYSCASKSSIPTTEVKKEELKATVSIPIATAKKTVMTAELAEGMSLYEYYCAKCHNLYSPNDFNAEEWKQIVARMQKEEQLTDLEVQKIYNYLTMN